MLIDAFKYKEIKSSMPIPCIDLVVVNDAAEVLMLKRVNDPAKGRWWFPGGRVYFGEKREEAVRRKLEQECGLLPKFIKEMGTADLLLDNSDGTLSHAITTIYLVKSDGQIVLDDQSELFEQKNIKEWLIADIDQFLKDTLCAVEGLNE